MTQTVPQDSFVPQSVGPRLRAAREQQGRDLDDIAMITRVPKRHLVAIEEGRNEDLPAMPYAVGFARSYAQAVGLDGRDVADDFRSELGGRPVSEFTEPFEPVDPKRVPPLMLALVALLIAVLLGTGYAVWRSGALSGDGPTVRAQLAAESSDDPAAATAPAGTQTMPVPVVPGARGDAVLLTATAPVWARITDAGGARLLEKEMLPGESFAIPVGARDPQIVTSRPQALRVTVGTVLIPPLGPPERIIRDVSLRPEALLARLRTGEAAAVAAPLR